MFLPHKTLTAVFLSFLLLLTSSPLPLLKPPIQLVYADNGFLDPDGDGTHGSWSSTGASFYTEVADATRQPTAPNTSTNNSGNSNNAGNIFYRMSSLSSVSSVSQIVVWVYHIDGSNGQISVQLVDDDEVTTRSSSSPLTVRTSTAAWDSVTFSGLSLTQSQLNTLSIELIPSKTGKGGGSTITVSALYADVTYTPAAAVSISLTTSGSLAFGTQVLNTTHDTTASDLNQVQTVSVDSGPANLVASSTNWLEGVNTWTLGASNGADQLKWEFSPDGSAWTTFAAAGNNYTLANSVAQGNTQNIYFRLTSPTSTSSYSQFSTTVTITASAP